jgi:ubiquitin C-terminal hydrolase
MKGLINIGNTCYLNASLQMLIQNKDLCDLILKYNTPILNTISNFINDYNSENYNILLPKDIKLLVEQRQEMFIGFRQHDSAEFIIFLLDIIDEEIKKINKQNTYNIDSIFQIESSVKIKCKLKSCLNISEHTEKNIYLLLDINNDTKTLDDCYRLSKSSELLEDNTYYCNNCKNNTIATKRTNIIKWSNNLIIWLKRFKQNGNKLDKVDNLIQIPLLWRHNMELQGFIIHSGGLHGGHYMYAGLVNNKWFLFNDSSVTEIFYTEQLNNFLNNAYLLYYKQKIN